MLYVAPERLNNELFVGQILDYQGGISMLAVE